MSVDGIDDPRWKRLVKAVHHLYLRILDRKSEPLSIEELTPYVLEDVGFPTIRAWLDSQPNLGETIGRLAVQYNNRLAFLERESMARAKVETQVVLNGTAFTMTLEHEAEETQPSAVLGALIEEMRATLNALYGDETCRELGVVLPDKTVRYLKKGAAAQAAEKPPAKAEPKAAEAKPKAATPSGGRVVTAVDIAVLEPHPNMKGVRCSLQLLDKNGKVLYTARTRKDVDAIESAVRTRYKNGITDSEHGTSYTIPMKVTLVPSSKTDAEGKPYMEIGQVELINDGD